MIKINETSSSVAWAISFKRCGWVIALHFMAFKLLLHFFANMFKNDYAAKPQRELKILAEMHSLCTGHGKVRKLRNAADSGRKEWDASCCHSAFSRKWRNAIIFYNL